MRIWITLALSLLPGTVLGQQANYIVKQGGTEIGRETLVQRSGTERSVDGTSIEVESRYGSGGASVILQQEPSGRVLLFRLRTLGPSPATILAATSGGRLAVRREAAGAESARELPAQPGMLLMDEQAWTLMQAVANAATSRGAPLILVFPRTDRSLRVTATRAGTAVTTTGELVAALQLDAEGRVQRIEIPAQNLVITRNIK